MQDVLTLICGLCVIIILCFTDLFTSNYNIKINFDPNSSFDL